jgi:inhibitor of KinA sporulation pathway (predicted exonuclease)
MPILIIDLEMTCADDGTITASEMEVIEMGACWVTEEGGVLDRFQSFVRPLERPQLTPFCTSLTGITQTAVDAAPLFPAAAHQLALFALKYGDASSHWGSWGVSDRKQIDQECVRHGLGNPLGDLVHRNLKAEFARRRKIKQVGMAMALQIVGLVREGAQHRALDDALNIARLLASKDVDLQAP